MKHTTLQDPPVFKTPVRAEPVVSVDEFEVAHAAHGHEDEVDLNVPAPRPVWVVVAGMIGLGAVVAMLLTGLIPRHRDAKILDADAAEAMTAPVMVNVVAPKRSAAATEITMPANMRPWQEVSIFARTTGYLKDYKVDISENVEKNAVMAEIDTPEVDRELEQATAAVAQAVAAKGKADADLNKAEADKTLATSTRNRYKKMREGQGVTEMQLEEKESAVSAADAAYASAQANVAAATANIAAANAAVNRLTEMTKFKVVRAPFSGVVTGRAYDRGSLITANPTATDIKPMFKIAQNDVLRAFVNVPQSAALRIRKGMKVKVTARERPAREFPGVVMGTTNYLDPTNRSLLTEVKVENPKEATGEYALLPGMYVQVSFTVNRDTPPLVVPAPSIVHNADGIQVATLKDGLVHFQKVTLGEDFGTEIEIVSGLTGDEKVITNPGERVVEGMAANTGS